LSFFDEADEPQTAPRTRSRPSARGRRPSGTGRRPPTDRQAVRARQAVLGVVVVIIIVLIAIGVHSCQTSATRSALQDYSNNVASLIQQSDQTGSQFFGILASSSGTSGATSLQTQINQTRVNATSELARAKSIDVPGEVQTAQQQLLLALRMRVDGITNIAAQIQPALGTTSARKDAINTIGAEMARFYGSDVVYKDYAVPEMVSALNGSGIAIGGTSGQPIVGRQFLPNIEWLSPSFIAKTLHVSLPNAGTGKIAPGLHGHALNSVKVAGTTLQTGSTNSIPASPAPAFTLNFTNGGVNNETNVVCKVTVNGTGVSGQTTVPETFAGQTTTCQVTLSKVPPRGTYTVQATIEPVPGEKTISNNSLSFPVTFS
jgi:hypothetical protein